MVLDQMHDTVKTSVNCPAILRFGAEILSSGALLVFGHMDGMVDQLGNAFVLGSRDRNDRHAKHLLHLVNQNRAAILPNLVHHVQRDDHRNIQLHQLHRQVQVPFNVCRVHDVDDALRMVVQNKLPGDNLLVRVGRHRINAGKICHQRIQVLGEAQPAGDYDGPPYPHAPQLLFPFLLRFDFLFHALHPVHRVHL